MERELITIATLASIAYEMARQVYIQDIVRDSGPSEHTMSEEIT